MDLGGRLNLEWVFNRLKGPLGGCWGGDLIHPAEMMGGGSRDGGVTPSGMATPQHRLYLGWNSISTHICAEMSLYWTLSICTVTCSASPPKAAYCKVQIRWALHFTAFKISFLCLFVHISSPLQSYHVRCKVLFSSRVTSRTLTPQICINDEVWTFEFSLPVGSAQMLHLTE